MTMLTPALIDREILVDERGDTLRSTWHGDERTFVLSMWRAGTCRATFHLGTDDAARLGGFLLAGLADASRRPAPAPPRGSLLRRWFPRPGR